MRLATWARFCTALVVLAVLPMSFPPGIEAASQPAVSFEAGITRLVGDSTSYFADVRNVTSARHADGETKYTLTFLIIGLSPCELDVFDDPGEPIFVICMAYQGTDDVAARNIYQQVSARLCALAPHLGGRCVDEAPHNGSAGSLRVSTTATQIAFESGAKASVGYTTIFVPASTAASHRSVGVQIESPVAK